MLQEGFSLGCEKNKLAHGGDSPFCGRGSHSLTWEQPAKNGGSEIRSGSGPSNFVILTILSRFDYPTVLGRSYSVISNIFRSFLPPHSPKRKNHMKPQNMKYIKIKLLG